MLGEPLLGDVAPVDVQVGRIRDGREEEEVLPSAGLQFELVGLGLLEASQATSETEFVPGPTPDDLEPPVVVWHEPMRQAAASCAYLPAQNPLCNQAPFS